MGNKELICTGGSYADIVVIIGSLDQLLSTDVLNMVLFSHETVISETTHIMEIFRGSLRPEKSSSATPPFLFQVQIRSENVSPWLRLTLTDTTNTAFRVMVETFDLFFSSRNVQNIEISEVYLAHFYAFLNRTYCVRIMETFVCMFVYIYIYLYIYVCVCL
ncbi:unnamed protein product [Gongylonema pulchrum]|uniref:Uncharacterized protein n=1 Tax=Gongylonema pulchrum TaxID=637853 RepID=A0A183D2A4_9BILA|nr:unnamed protein product [Gongylonema pulchrum]